jgi:hypothetical protein
MPKSKGKRKVKVGVSHGPGINNPAVFEALVNKRGMSESRAAKISNGLLKRGVKRGRRSRKGK